MSRGTWGGGREKKDGVTKKMILVRITDSHRTSKLYDVLKPRQHEFMWTQQKILVSNRDDA